jgi:hypothetical protein
MSQLSTIEKRGASENSGAASRGGVKERNSMAVRFVVLLVPHSAGWPLRFVVADWAIKRWLFKRTTPVRSAIIFPHESLQGPNCYVIFNIRIGALLLQAQQPARALLVKTLLINKWQVHLDWPMGIEFSSFWCRKGIDFLGEKVKEWLSSKTFVLGRYCLLWNLCLRWWESSIRLFPHLNSILYSTIQSTSLAKVT